MEIRLSAARFFSFVAAVLMLPASVFSPIAAFRITRHDQRAGERRHHLAVPDLGHLE